MPLIFGGGIIAGLLPVLYLSAKEIAGPSIGKLVDKLKKNKNYKMSNSEKSDVKGFVSKVKKDKPSLLQKVMKKFKEEVELDEGRMKELHGYIAKGMSAAEIAKKMKLDVKTIKALMDEVDLDEAVLKGRDYEYDEKKGVVKISKKNFAKVHKDAKGTDKSKPTMMVLTKKGTSLVPVQFEEVELDEAKKVTKKERDRLEDLNQHGLLALKLTQAYGTPAEVKKIKAINKRHEQKGHIERKDQKERDAISNKYYKMAEESEVEEAYEYGTTEYANHTKEVTPGQEVDEASARADAKRSMRRDPSMRKQSPFSKDVSATDDDVKAASKNIIMQMRKAVSLRGKFPVQFADKKKIKIPADIAQAVQQKYNSFKKPADKEKFQAKVGKSYKDMLRALREEVQEEKTILDRIEEIIKENKNG